MLVIKSKLFSNKQNKPKGEKKEESNTEKAKKAYDKLTTEQKAQAYLMLVDGYESGRKKYVERQSKSGLIGAGAGTVAGLAGAAIAKRPEASALGAAGGAILGSVVSRGITKKGSKKIAQKVLDKSRKEYEDYIIADKRKKKEIEDNYIPVYNRTDKKGEDLEEKDYRPYNKSRNEAIRTELSARMKADAAYRKEKIEVERRKIKNQEKIDRKRR